jgi:hypothetical protein
MNICKVTAQPSVKTRDNGEWEVYVDALVSEGIETKPLSWFFRDRPLKGETHEQFRNRAAEAFFERLNSDDKSFNN